MTHASSRVRLLLGNSDPGKIADWRAMLGHLALEIKRQLRTEPKATVLRL